MPGKLRLQGSSRLHHINSLSLLSASCPLLTRGERKAHQFRLSPWELFWSLHVSSVCCYVGLCTNEVVDCDQVKVPGNTVEVVTGHALPVQHAVHLLCCARHSGGTFLQNAGCLKSLQTVWHQEMGITANTFRHHFPVLFSGQQWMRKELHCQTFWNFVLFTLYFSHGTFEYGSCAELFHCVGIGNDCL